MRKLFHECNDRAMVLLAIEDISERRADERQTAELLHQKETLLEEMQHRIANSRQIIANILLMKTRAVQSAEARLFLKETHQRIMSIAAVQLRLGIARHGEQIERAPYFSRLCGTRVASLIGVNRPISISAQADEAKVPAAAAVSIGLIVTEPVINARKQAFVSAMDAGLIVVSCETTEACWRLTVSDNGVGMSNGAPATVSPGLGAGIVGALARQLDERMETSMEPNGTSVPITRGSFRSPLPLPPGAQPRQALNYPDSENHSFERGS